MVLTTAGGQTLTIDKDDRVISSQGFYKSENIDLMKVSVSNGEKSTNLYVRFNSEATNEFDRDWDAHKLFGFSDIPKVFSYDENTKYSINSLPSTQTTHIVNIGVNSVNSASYTFEFSNLSEISNLYGTIKLEDILTGIWVDIAEGTQYSFEAQEGDNENRFKLHFGATGIDNEPIAAKWLVSASGQQLFVSGENGQTEVSVYNTQGQQVMLKKIEIQGEVRLPLNLSTGVYLVTLNNGRIVETTKIIIK